jgi:hypothetical protein
VPASPFNIASRVAEQTFRNMERQFVHRRIVCVCGIVISQCRCPGPKVEKIVSPCEHTQEQKAAEAVPLSVAVVPRAVRRYAGRKGRPPAVQKRRAP